MEESKSSVPMKKLLLILAAAIIILFVIATIFTALYGVSPFGKFGVRTGIGVSDGIFKTDTPGGPIDTGPISFYGKPVCQPPCPEGSTCMDLGGSGGSECVKATNPEEGTCGPSGTACAGKCNDGSLCTVMNNCDCP